MQIQRASIANSVGAAADSICSQPWGSICNNTQARSVGRNALGSGCSAVAQGSHPERSNQLKQTEMAQLLLLPHFLHALMARRDNYVEQRNFHQRAGCTHSTACNLGTQHSVDRVTAKFICLEKMNFLNFCFNSNLSELNFWQIC